MPRPFQILVSVLILLVALTDDAAAHPSSGIVVDQNGRVVFADNGGDQGRVWMIDTSGKLTRLDQAGWHWIALDEKGRYSAADLKTWFDQRITMNFGRVPLPNSKAVLLQADGAPFVIAADGNLYWAKGNLEIAKLSPTGGVTQVGTDLKATTEKLGGIKGLATGRNGSLYAACPSAVLKIEANGKLTTLVHPIVLKEVETDVPKGTPDDHKPFLRGLTVDSHETVYAAATGARCVVKVMPDGKVDVALKAEAPWSPTGIAAHGDDVYVLEYAHANDDNHDDWRPRVRKFDRRGKVDILADIRKETHP